MSWRVFLLGVCLSLLWKYSNAQLPYIGLQFTTELPDQSFQLIASCYSGANVIASSANQVYTSTDYGYTFTLSAFSNSAPYSFSWIDISGNGQTYYAAANSPAVTLYRSNTPQSSSWTATASIASVIPGITAMDVDQSGLHVVLVYGTSNPNNIYAAYSADNATTFTVLTGVTSPCTSVAIDSTGASIAAASIDGYIFVSSNSGQTFVKHLVYGASYNLNVAASAYSKNKYIYAMNQASSTTMMKSSDYGANWTAQTVYTTTAVSTSLPFSCSGSGSTLSLNLGNVLIASKDYAVQWAEVLQIIAIGNSFNQVVVSGNGESIYLATAFGIMLSHSSKCSTFYFFFHQLF